MKKQLVGAREQMSTTAHAPVDITRRLASSIFPLSFSPELVFLTNVFYYTEVVNYIFWGNAGTNMVRVPVHS